MKERTDSRHSHARQCSEDFNPKRHWTAFVVLLLFVIASLPILSFAQPLASGKSKFVGNVISYGNSIRSDFSKYWNQVTPENAGKWSSVEFNPGVYNWTELDNIYNYALANGFPYKHHNLIWGQQQPNFMSGLDSASQYQEIENWIKNSGQRYPKADFCDVVNEPLHAQPSYKNALGGNGATGWDWVVKAFELARRYWSPTTKLLINEYSVINDVSSNANYLQIINLLKSRGLVDGIGVQGHRFEIESPSTSTLQANLDRLAATGLPIYISEFDLGNIANSGTPNDSVQLALYQQKFPVLWEHPAVQGITLWGYVQGQTWQYTAYLLRSNGTERPALQWLRLYLAIPMPPVLVSPVETTGEPRNTLLVWHPSASALWFELQIATNSTFSSDVMDFTVVDTLTRLSPLATNARFYWHVRASNDSGASAYSVTASFATGDLIVAVKELEGTPTEFALSQNYPNPFNPTTQIGFSIPKLSHVSLRVYNLLGQEVAMLFDGIRQPGNYVVTFNGTRLASGVYLYRLIASDFAKTRRLVLVR